MGWFYLCVAGFFEIGWAIGLKYSEGFSRPWPSAWTLLAMIGSFYFLALGLRTIPVGTGYAVWTGIGAVGTAMLGIVLFAESTALPRLASLALIILGILGLKASS